LASYDGSPVLVRQNRVIAASFHPELTDDLRIHKYFLEIAESVK
ncbi:glutamine amidotransferase, partial [Mesotoga sp. SC_3PWM13N19]